MEREKQTRKAAGDGGGGGDTWKNKETPAAQNTVQLGKTLYGLGRPGESVSLGGRRLHFKSISSLPSSTGPATEFPRTALDFTSVSTSFQRFGRSGRPI